nr:retrotransposon protein, putative, Ty1-copia subclass [Tanacetum cinerariifolium]
MEPLHAHEMLQELKTVFAQQVEQELLQTTRAFHSCRQKDGQSVSSYVLKMKGYIDNLEHLGRPNYNMHNMEKTVNELHAMLKLHEKTLSKKQRSCSSCYSSRTLEEELSSVFSRVAEEEKEHSFGNWWVRANRKLKPGALSLYVGNGQREAVKATDAFHLCLSSGLEIVLNNCHYAPSITRGVISVSCLYEDGFINCFVNNTIQVNRNNMVYFSAIPRDGIFEIDFSNSHINESFIYVVSNKRAKLDLDSALLWHCHLGHISKKRIEKLQHDGLLDSLTSGLLKNVSLDQGIIAHRTPPYTPQHNGVSKRRNRTLLDMVRSMMSQTTLLKSFWDYALETATSILNMVLTKKVEKTPYEGLEDLVIIKEEDMHPSIDTSLNHEEDDLEIDEPQSDIISIRRSIRTRHALDRMCLYIDAEEHELGDLGEPANYKDALLDPESKKWLNAVNVEMQSIKDNEVWVLVELPPNGKTVGEAAYILGNKIYRDRSRRLIGLCQSAYIEKILKRFCIKNSKHGSIPMQEKLELSKSQGASTPAELKRMQNVPYASAIGFIIDIKVSCYTNAGYLMDVDDLKSQTGYVFVLNGGAVDWKSAKQSIFATLSAEAEYIAAFDASKEAVWLRKFISGWVWFP